jgi:hypothetical protein
MKYPKERIVDPALLDVPGWSQAEYHRFWVEVLQRVVDLAVFAPGWQFSNGCSVEFATCLHRGIPSFDTDGRILSACRAADLLDRALVRLERTHLPSLFIAASLGFVSEFVSKEKDARQP